MPMIKVARAEDIREDMIFSRIESSPTTLSRTRIMTNDRGRNIEIINANTQYGIYSRTNHET